MRLIHMPDGKSSTFIVVQYSIYHSTTGPCVNFGGVVDWKSTQLKAKAQVTTELWHGQIVYTSNSMSGKMVIWGKSAAWYGTASIVYLLWSILL